MIKVIAFDADDTLWENEQFYRLTENEFHRLLSDHAESDHLEEKLLAAEKRNLELYGYGIKGFMLSMIETALEVTRGDISTQSIGAILAIGKSLLAHPIELIPGAEQTLDALAEDYQLWLITKGDLFDQERKIAQSGLAEKFDTIEILAEKSTHAYERIFSQHSVCADEILMVGNSLKSDITPVLEVGGWAVFVPHDLTWAHEHVDEPIAHPRYRRIAALAELPALVETLTP
ncbi:putative hydrolase of the HAD superfamily [Cohaesibacter sp. ES.047]|uniref:HAD family hydrolase n=1 Tax=Cohaesibacter sp. ES.047 TaxID=1798205 RepID=UPI000BB6D116|nr:HAD family hydrolase [Cohaesibacter sp. ES.047]SNY92330.1 putative hydrolase of the HAD superfamily [Cohaesibacter sp. ES.047]